MKFSLDFETVDTDKYLKMLIAEHHLGTNDYCMHDRNKDYWDILLAPAKNPDYKVLDRLEFHNIYIISPTVHLDDTM